MEEASSNVTSSQSLSSSPSQLSLWILIFVYTILALFGAYNTDFFTRGEGREALNALSVLSLENVILPRGYSGEVASKPPFLHWAMALSASILSGPKGGGIELAMRLPSIIAGVGFLVYWFFFLKTRVNGNTTILGVFLLAFAPEWARHTVLARTDMVHSVAVAGTLIIGFKLINFRATSARVLLGALLLTVAILSKGPIGLAISAVVLTIYFFITGSKKGKLPPLCYLLLFGSVLPLAWYIAASYIGGDEFQNKVFGENYLRFMGQMDGDPHDHSLLYLLGLTFLAFLPGFATLTLGLVQFRTRLFSPTKEAWQNDNFFRFALLATTVIFIIYAIPPGKRSVYLLAAYPFLAYIVARVTSAWMEELMNDFSRIFRVRPGVLFITLYGIGVGVLQPFLSYQSSAKIALAAYRDQILSEAPILSLNHEFYGESFYARRVFYRTNLTDIKARIDRGEHFFVLTTKEELVTLLREDKEKVLLSEKMVDRNLGSGIVLYGF